MPSTLAKKIGYIKDRCVNAYWMLRAGKFGLIFKSIHVEIGHRIAGIQARLEKGKVLDDSQVPGSAFVNKRKVLPPSCRPTVSHPLVLVPLRADPLVVANELTQILSTLSPQESSNS